MHNIPRNTSFSYLFSDTKYCCIVFDVLGTAPERQYEFSYHILNSDYDFKCNQIARCSMKPS